MTPEKQKEFLNKFFELADMQFASMEPGDTIYNMRREQGTHPTNMLDWIEAYAQERVEEALMREKVKHLKGVEVIRYTLDGGFDRVYPSVRSAAKENNINSGSLYVVLGRNKRGKLGNYRWQYR